MRYSPRLVCAILLSLLSGAFLKAAEPANPKTLPSARLILNRLQESETRLDHRLVSGQFAGTGKGANGQLLEDIREKSGHTPGLIGVDYADFEHGSVTTTIPNQVALAHWKAGGWVTVSTHLFNPANPAGGGLRDKGVDIQMLLTPGTETHSRWIKELDLIAAGLQGLKDAGVVVLWRPFHEMNGGWFWWGAKKPETFIKVWQQMFDYFTKIKGLDNLLWVYSPNHGDKTAAYYPGDHYVDLIGLDAYTDFVDQAHIKGYSELAKLAKPFGFTEYGPHGPTNPPGDFDYRRFLAGLKQEFPRTVFFMCWDARWSLNRNLNAREMLGDSWVLNLEDLNANAPRNGPSRKSLVPRNGP